MKKLSISVLLLAAACSGYEGGGDRRIAPVADSGVPPTTTDAGGGPDSGSPGPRDGGIDSSKPAPSSVIVYYPLDGQVQDLSPRGLGLDLELVTGQYESAKVDLGLVAGASGVGARRPQLDEAFNFEGDFTMQEWVLADSAPTGIATLQLSGPSSSGWSLLGTSSTVVFRAGSATLNTSFPSSQTWRHIAVRRRNFEVQLFVNGVSVAQQSNATPMIAAQPFAIVRATGVSNFAGKVDEVVIWSRALDDSEIQAQYSRGSSGQPVSLEE